MKRILCVDRPYHPRSSSFLGQGILGESLRYSRPRTTFHVLRRAAGVIATSLLLGIVTGCNSDEPRALTFPTMTCRKVLERRYDSADLGLEVEIQVSNHTGFNWEYVQAASRAAGVDTEVHVAGRWRRIRTVKNDDVPGTGWSVIRSGETQLHFISVSLVVKDLVPLRDAMNGNRCRFSLLFRRQGKDRVEHRAVARSTEVSSPQESHESDAMSQGLGGFPKLRCKSITEYIKEDSRRVFAVELVLLNATPHDWVYSLESSLDATVTTEVRKQRKWVPVKCRMPSFPIAGLIKVRAGQTARLGVVVDPAERAAGIRAAMNGANCRFALWLHLSGKAPVEHIAYATSCRVSPARAWPRSRPK